MKKTVVFILVLSVIISACNSNTKKTQPLNETTDNSRNSLDWQGVYRGVLPCADCEGIETEIKLNKDLTYEITSKYLGKTDEVFKENGSFKWDEAGAKITLENLDAKTTANQYLVGEDKLIKLDTEGNKIEGDLKEMYQLKKVISDDAITEKYLKLIELNEKKIVLGKNQDLAPHLILKNENNIVSGNGGCNVIHGNFELFTGNKIKFSKMATTRMFCEHIKTEQEFLDILEMADNYSVNKDTLELKNATMTSLAKFQLISSE